MSGATRATDTSTICPGATVCPMGVASAASMRSPESNTTAKSAVQVHEPVFRKRQVLVNAVPGSKTVPSGTVTSATNSARRQGKGVAEGVRVGVGEAPGDGVVAWGAGVGVPVGCGRAPEGVSCASMGARRMAEMVTTTMVTSGLSSSSPPATGARACRVYSPVVMGVHSASAMYISPGRASNTRGKSCSSGPRMLRVPWPTGVRSCRCTVTRMGRSTRAGSPSCGAVICKAGGGGSSGSKRQPARPTSRPTKSSQSKRRGRNMMFSSFPKALYGQTLGSLHTNTCARKKWPSSPPLERTSHSQWGWPSQVLAT